MQNPSFGRLNRVRIRRKVGKRWSTKSSDRRREEHKETKRYRGFLTSSDIGTYPAHAVLTEKFRWVSVIFRGCGRLITPCDARPFSRAPRGIVARTLRVLLTPWWYFKSRKPIHSQNAPLNYRVIASPLAIRRLKTSMYVNSRTLTHGRQKISASDCLPIDTIESKRSQTTTRIPTPPRRARMPPCAAVVAWITEPGVAIGRRSTPRDAAHSRAESTPHTLSRTRCTPLERSRRSSRTRRLSSRTRTRRHRHVTDDGRR